MKRSLFAALAILMAALLCSCSGLNLNISENLTPPKPSGELYEIQKALEKSAGHNINLVYPSSGQYRSAIITKDIDSDGKPEVFSFYSTKTDDNSMVMHINYIRWTENGWVSVSDLQVGASGVESVEFANLDKNKVPKVIVNWSRYSAVDKLLSVYETTSGILSELASANYSVYATTDFDSDGISDIVAFYLNQTTKTASATLLTLGEKGFEAASSCKLDGEVTAYSEPIVSKLTNGTPAVFVDAEKSTGLITEIVYMKDSSLVNAFDTSQTSTPSNIKTLRASAVRSEDFNGDGYVDIPLAYKLPLTAGETEADRVYMTEWNSFDGHVFTPIAHTVVNYNDGYYITVPDTWKNTFTITRKIDQRIRIVLRWDSEFEETGEEILRVQTVALKEWKQNAQNYENFFEITRTAEFAYIARMGNSALNPGSDYLKENFHIIGNNPSDINS